MRFFFFLSALPAKPTMFFVEPPRSNISPRSSRLALGTSRCRVARPRPKRSPPWTANRTRDVLLDLERPTPAFPPRFARGRVSRRGANAARIRSLLPNAPNEQIADGALCDDEKGPNCHYHAVTLKSARTRFSRTGDQRKRSLIGPGNGIASESQSVGVRNASFLAGVAARRAPVRGRAGHARAFHVGPRSRKVLVPFARVRLGVFRP